MGMRSSRCRNASASMHAMPASVTQMTGMMPFSAGPIIDTLSPAPRLRDESA